MKKTAFALFLLLAACSGTPKEAGDCPVAGVLQGAGNIPIFTGSAAKDNIRVRGTFGTFRGACRQKTSDSVEFLLEIDILANKTALAGGLQGLKLPYFIAVVDDGENVLQKERFWTKVDFDNKSAAKTTEEHTIRFPLSSGGTPRDYKIVFGFELTKEQLDFNRGDIR
jgi:hypothetical protein